MKESIYNVITAARVFHLLVQLAFEIPQIKSSALKKDAYSVLMQALVIDILHISANNLEKVFNNIGFLKFVYTSLT